MIKNKIDYEYYVNSDRIALHLPVKFSFKEKIRNCLFPNYIWRFQVLLRKVEYYENTSKGIFKIMMSLFVRVKYHKLSRKLGFSIPPNVFGPGLSIAHIGTIIVSGGATVGSNCRLHACVNIGTEAGYSDKAPQIGDNCYIGPGVKMYGAIKIGSGTAIGANSVVNKSFEEGGVAIAGIPAKIIKEIDTRKLLIVVSEILPK